MKIQYNEEELITITKAHNLVCDKCENIIIRIDYITPPSNVGYYLKPYQAKCSKCGNVEEYTTEEYFKLKEKLYETYYTPLKNIIEEINNDKIRFR